MTVQQWVTPSDTINVGAVRRRVVAFAAEHGVAGPVLRDLTLAVSELATNVLLCDAPPRAARISVDVRDDSITVVMRGAAAGLSPRLDAAAAHLGMVVVASLAQDVRVVRTEDGGREVSMTLMRDAAASSAS